METLTPAIIPPSNITVKGDELEVTAQTPDEMAQANTALIEWCNHKIDMLQREHGELNASYLHAKKCKWKFDTLERHAKLALSRVSFYEKVRSALQAGYYIVPNFPVTAFAIRTDRSKPLKMISNSRWDRMEQKMTTLPAGEGEYRNPFPDVWQRDVTNNEQKAQGKTNFNYWAESWREMEFPINMSRPRIMEASSRAMALKIFDDLGVLPDPSRKADPVVIARIKDPRSTPYNTRHISFLIAWALDTRTI